MIRLRALLMGAALITGVSALASAQPLPQHDGNYGVRDSDRGRDHDRKGRAYGYYNRDRDNRGYYGRSYNHGYYGREDYVRRWRDRDDRRYRDRDDWRYRNRGRDWDHDGDRR